MILSETALFNDFIRLSYNKDNLVLRVVMRWIYETCKPNSNFEGLPDAQTFYECFYNDPSYNSDDFKTFVFKFCESAKQHWKIDGEKNVDEIVKKAMKITAFAVAETKMNKLSDKSSNEAADSLFDIFEESLESSEKLNSKDFYKRFREEMSISEGNNDIKNVVEMYYEVGEALLDFIKISKNNSFVKWVAIIKEFLNDQLSVLNEQYKHGKALVVSTKKRVTNANDVILQHGKGYYDSLFVFAEPKIELISFKLTESKNYIKIQLNTAYDSVSSENLKNYVLENYKLVSLKSEQVKEIVNTYKVEVAKYLLNNKEVLYQLIESNKQKLQNKYTEIKCENQKVQDIHAFVEETLERIVKLYNTAQEKVQVSKDLLVEKYNCTKDISLDKYNQLLEASSDKINEYSQVLDDKFGDSKQKLITKYDETKVCAFNLYDKSKTMTLEEAERLKSFSLELLQMASTFFLNNRQRLIEFVAEFNLRERVLPFYNKTLEVYENGKGKALELYDTNKQYSMEVMQNLVQCEYAELVKARLNKLISSFKDYSNMKLKEYKNVETIRDFFLYENSLIYLHSVKNLSK